MNIIRSRKIIYAVIFSVLFIINFYCSHQKMHREWTSQNQKQRPYTKKSTQTMRTNIEYGKASFYAKKFHGRYTANGEIYDQNQLTAAHKTLPFGTICRVTNRSNGKSVVVRINDRGPFKKERIIDLSYKAMSLLKGVRQGVIDVKVEINIIH